MFCYFLYVIRRDIYFVRTYLYAIYTYIYDYIIFFRVGDIYLCILDGDSVEMTKKIPSTSRTFVVFVVIFIFARSFFFVGLSK